MKTTGGQRGGRMVISYGSLLRFSGNEGKRELERHLLKRCKSGDPRSGALLDDLSAKPFLITKWIGVRIALSYLVALIDYQLCNDVGVASCTILECIAGG